MYLLEHDAKQLLARHGIPVPDGRLVERGASLDAAALPPGPWMVKGQIAAGGRGKAGIVRKAATPQEIANAAVFLASPASSFTTGSNLVVDGAISNRVNF